MKIIIHKTIYLTVLILYFSMFIQSQEKSRYKCAYEVSVQRDTITQKTFPKDTYIVQVGKYITKGFFYRSFYYDSLYNVSKYLHNQVRQLELTEAGKLKGDSQAFKDKIAQFFLYFRSIHYKDYQKNEMIILENIAISNRFVFTDELQPQDWEIQTDTMTILGYHSQKATCHYRGRDWIAWFTSEIPISEGPWKFYGLPGLITKVADDKEHYSFTLTGFQEIEESIDTDIPKRAEKTTREEFVKLLIEGELERSTSARAGESIGLSSDGNTKKNNENYDYIETDYKEWRKEK